MVLVRFDELCMAFPVNRRGVLPVLDHLNCQVQEGEFVSFLGPSGCGKSTLLNIMAGMLSPASGRILIGDQVIDASSRVRPDGIGYVFQEPRLLDWLTVEKNLRFILKPTSIPRCEWDGRIDHFLRMVGLEAFRRRYPLELSGGMRSRIALIRALVIEPNLLLMDEPLSSIDAITAARIRADFVRIWLEHRPTILFVTHDISEAVYLSDRILLLTSRPARIHGQIAIEAKRPRALADRSLLEIETEIKRIFFEEILPEKEENRG